TKSSVAPRALAANAHWRWNADDDAGAQALFREVIERFPESVQAPEAEFSIGRMLQEAGRFDDAAAAFARVAERWPESPLASEARWRTGWVRYLAGDFAGAADRFAAMNDLHDERTSVAAEYWRARSLEHLGNSEAQRLYRDVVDHHPWSS